MSVHEVPGGLISLERSAEQERARLAGLTGDGYGTRLRPPARGVRRLPDGCHRARGP
ncbi:hypothetical protein [Streptomyces eurythermus]